MDNTTLAQASQMLNLITQKKLDCADLQALYTSGLLAKLLDAAAKKTHLIHVNPFDFLRVLGLDVPDYLIRGSTYKLNRYAGSGKSINTAISEDIDASGLNLNELMGDYTIDNESLFPSSGRFHLFAVNRQNVNEVVKLLEEKEIVAADRETLSRFARENSTLEESFSGRVVALNSFIDQNEDRKKPHPFPMYCGYPYLQYLSGEFEKVGFERGDVVVQNGNPSTHRIRHFFLASFKEYEPEIQ